MDKPMYHEIVIAPCPSGFGEYQALPVNGEGWVDAYDLECEIRGLLSCTNWESMNSLIGSKTSEGASIMSQSECSQDSVGYTGIQEI